MATAVRIAEPTPDEITAPPPPDVLAELDGLDRELDASIPARQLDRNLLVATWNVRAFGDITQRWRSTASDSPKRDLANVLSIAHIVSRFDVVAIQEVRGNLKGLRHLMKALGPGWSFTLTDVCRGREGNDERLAFVFDTRRVRLSGLACELSYAAEEAGIAQDAFARQFARTPYAVSFLAGGTTFILVTLHVRYGEGPEDRTGELSQIATWLAGWAEEINEWGHNLIALGDFNIDRAGDPLYEAFTSTGLRPPDALNHVRRTIFEQHEGHSFYDQIAWFAPGGTMPALTLACANAGGFDFASGVIASDSKLALSWRISDHYPLWVEFSTR